MMEKQVYPDLREYPGGPPQRPYDVTAHTLPMQMGVKVITVNQPFQASLTKVEKIAAAPGAVEAAPVTAGPAKAYLLEHDSNASMKALNRLMKDKAEVYWAAKPFSAKNKLYSAGTMIVHGGAGIENKLQAIARELSVNFVAINDRFNVQAYKLIPPRIGLYKSHVASMDEGWTRLIFETYEFPFANILDKDIRAGGLRSKYDVIIIPGELSETQIIEGHRNGTVPPEFAGGIGEAGVQNLRDFVNEGGTLVTMDKATEFAAKQFALPVKNALEGVKPQDFYVPGSLLKIVLDTENPIAYGMPRETAAFVEQNAAFDAWKVRCSDQVRQHRQVAAPQRAIGGELRRAFEGELDGVLGTREQAPAVVERERRGRLGAKVVRRERSGERDQARCREGRQLKRREIAVAEPALVRCRDRGEIESVEQPRPPVAAAHGDGELDAWIFGHAHHRGEPLRIGRRKALPARGHRGIDDDAMTRAFEPGDRARDRFRLDYEARGRVQTNAVGAGLHSGRSGALRDHRWRYLDR